MTSSTSVISGQSRICASTYRGRILEPEQGVVLESKEAILPFLVHMALTTYIQDEK